VNVI
jgi:hypothetical protein